MENRNKKKFTWSDASVEVLLTIWQEFIPDLRQAQLSAKRNSHIYGDIKEKMEDYGVYCDTSEITNKIKNLTQRYRTEKKIVGHSGGKPSEWKWFEQINEMLGKFPVNNSNLIEESIENLPNTDEEVYEAEYLELSFMGDSETVNIPSTLSTSSSERAEKSNPAKHRKAKMVFIHQEMLEEMKKSNKIEEDRNKREERYFELSSQFMKNSIDKQEMANNISERALLLAEDNLKLQKILVNSLRNK